MSERIRWEPTEYGGWTGHIGNIEGWLFQVWKTPSGNWQLDSTLPGPLDECRYGDDPDVLKAEAERWLEEFVSSLGAVFPEPCDSLADWVMDSRDSHGNAILRYKPTDGLYRVLPVEES